MKKFLAFLFFISLIIPVLAQTDRTNVLQKLENSDNQQIATTATLKSASRLFGAKDDLTTVIMIIPSGSKVSVLGSDSTYLHVSFDENEGYILKRQAVLDIAPVAATPEPITQQPVRINNPGQSDRMSRFSYLENKYGSGIAARLNAGKIWKGMNAEMVSDSWGNALKINRVINGNIIKEEWTFKNTRLYFENNILVNWGPVRR